MRLTTLKNDAPSRTMNRAFRGYNHNLVINDSEFYDMKNMTGDYYPVLSPRQKRLHIAQFSNGSNGLFSKTKLFYSKRVEITPYIGDKYWATYIYYNGLPITAIPIPTSVPFEFEDNEKQCISIGANVLIWPDKRVINVETGEMVNLGPIDSDYGVDPDENVRYSLSRINGDEYDPATISDTEPSSPSDGDMWVDTSSVPHTLKVYSAYSESWTPVFTTYVKIELTSVGQFFNKGDGVFIEGSSVIPNGTYVIQNIYSDSIVIIGMIDQVTQVHEENMVITRKAPPDMDFLTVLNNRVWGCSSKHHEIYCSKLGDPFNWYVYEGLSTDSYAATIGSDGDFTGAVAYNNMVLFFKEDRVHYVQGDKPSNFVIGEKPLRGVEQGSEKSMAIVNEILYYKSPEGIVAYTGSYPDSLYGPFGDVRYKNAVGGGARDKYYVSMQSEDDGTWNMFCFDTKKGLWYKEDDLHVTSMTTWNNELFYTDADGNFGSIFGTTGGEMDWINNAKADPEQSDDFDVEEEPDINWYVESGNIGLDLPDNKTVSRILIRLSVSADAEVSVKVMYDSSGIWTGARTIHTHNLNSFTIPIIPSRCDHMKIRIEGIGECKIYSISKEIENGSELHGYL